MCKHDEMVGEINEKAVKGRSVIGILARAMRWRNVYGGEERAEEQHSPSNIDIGMGQGPGHGTQHSS